VIQPGSTVKIQGSPYHDIPDGRQGRIEKAIFGGYSVEVLASTYFNPRPKTCWYWFDKSQLVQVL
jgi:hypothetical protein